MPWPYLRSIGDLVGRDDGVNNVHKTFTHDALNRLTNTTMTGATALAKSHGYSSTGNLTYQSDIGTLVNPQPCEVKAHGVKCVTGAVNGLVNPTYEYDTVGILTADAPRVGVGVRPRQAINTGWPRAIAPNDLFDRCNNIAPYIFVLAAARYIPFASRQGMAEEPHMDCFSRRWVVSAP